MKTLHYSIIAIIFFISVLVCSNLAFASDPSVTCGNNVYSVDDRAYGSYGAYNVIFKKSSDGGSTYDNRIILSNETLIDDTARITASGNNVYVAWINNVKQVEFTKSVDGGKSFGGISIFNSTGFSSELQIAANGNNVYMIWEDGQKYNNNVFFTASADAGNHFATPRPMGLGGTGPKIAISDNNVYVASFGKGKPDKGNVIFSPWIAKSNDGGNNFEKPIELDKLDNYTWWFFPAQDLPTLNLLVSDNNVFVTWLQSVYPSGYALNLVAESFDGTNNFKVEKTSEINNATAEMIRTSHGSDNCIESPTQTVPNAFFVNPVIMIGIVAGSIAGIIIVFSKRRKNRKN